MPDRAPEPVLAPCPFCGGTPEVETETLRLYKAEVDQMVNKEVQRIACTTRDCQVKPATEFGPWRNIERAWNQRSGSRVGVEQ